MPACKDKYYWCKDEPSVCRDGDGMRYCVFHAPKGKKGVSLEDFNKKIFAKIGKAQMERNECDLSWTIFEGDISFWHYDKTNPLPEINFFFATFNGEANFWEVIFSGEANFNNATFSGEAWFSDTTFGEEADFFGVTFSGEANFSDATFSKKADFSLAKFNGGAYFRGNGIDADRKGVFKKGAKFNRFSVKEKIIFEGVNLEEVSFLDSDLRKADFINCEWPKKDYRWLPSFIAYRIRPEYRRNVLYDENELFNKRNSKENKIDEGEIKKVGVLYRMLKQKYVDDHDWPEVSNWHYGEKEMYRKGSRFRRFFPLSISNLYWLFGGYGERPVRAGAWLWVFIVAVAGLMWWLGFAPADNLNYESSVGAYFLNALQYVTFYKDPIFKPTSLWGETVALFARVVIPLQAALFVLAVRNRFRR